MTLPSASTRLQIALKVTKVVERLHVAGWWHKDLRSVNIVFFPHGDEEVPWTNPSAFEELLLHPTLMGFSFAREASESAISEQPSKEVEHDIYRHVDALGEPSASFDKDKDNYALGMVLVEIAEWLPLHSILEKHHVIDFKQDVRLEQLSKIQSYMLRDGRGSIVQSVAFRLGQAYLRLVMLCPNAPSETTPSTLHGNGDVSLRQEMFDEAVRELEKCRL